MSQLNGESKPQDVHVGDSNVAPSTVDEEQLGEEAELSNGVVGGHGSLRSLETSDTDSDVSLLNHGNVVGT